ncbi:MAG: hypothetical protein WCR67_02725 [Bacilli bacterium]
MKSKKLSILFLSLFLVSCNSFPSASTSSESSTSIGDSTLISDSTSNVDSSDTEESDEPSVNPSVSDETSQSPSIDQSTEPSVGPSSDISDSTSDEPSDKHKVDFVNYDDSLLFSVYVNDGENAVYSGDEPVKPSDSDYWTFAFDGWDKSVSEIHEDTTFKAQFTADYDGYTPVHEIVSRISDGTTGETIKTWGTITGFYTNNGTNTLYMQSIDADHFTSGIMIYGYSSSLSLSIGNVISLTGKSANYGGCPELINSSNIKIDKYSSDTPVQAYEPPVDFWKNLDDSTSENYRNAKALGTLQVVITGQLEYSSGQDGYIYFNDGEETAAKLFLRQNSNLSTIQKLLVNHADESITITGYLSASEKSGTNHIIFNIISPNDILVEGETPVDPKAYTLNSSSFKSLSITKYPTGCYTSAKISNYYWQTYRAYLDNQKLTLFGLADYSPDFISGSIQNSTPFNKITNISLTYTCAKDEVLSVGTSGYYEKTDSIPASAVSTTASFDFDQSENISFLSISAFNSTLSIDEIKITYDTSAISTNHIVKASSGEGRNRIEPVIYSGTLEAGVSYVEVPDDIQVNGTTYSILTTKKYTYYTYSYVSSHQEVLEDSIQIDPNDVAAYYIAFNTYPANYATSGNFYTVSTLYGDNTRQVSQVYTRTDGYVNYVPYRNASDNKPHYIELDIALCDFFPYSSNHRSVGRVVVWFNGFTTYGNYPTAVYTDDHYDTFQEFYNYGDSFSHRFDAQCGYTSSIKTCYQYSEPTTVSLAQ